MGFTEALHIKTPSWILISKDMLAVFTNYASVTQQMDSHPNKRTIGQTVSPNKSIEQGSTNSKRRKRKVRIVSVQFVQKPLLTVMNKMRVMMQFTVRVSVMGGCTDSVQVCLKWYSSLSKL